MGRTCVTCIHPQHEAIDKALVTGEPYRNVAKHFGASPPSVYRHQQDHLPVALVKAKKAQGVAHGDDLLAQLRELQGKALEILTQAEKAGDLRTALMAVREVRGTLELVAKVTGELVNKVEHTGAVDHRHIFESWTDEELRQLVALRGQLTAGGLNPKVVEGELVGEGGNSRGR